MSFWTSAKLKAELQKGSLITPTDLNRVQHGAYELALGGEYYDTSMKDGKGTKAPGGQIVIPPGQLALLITHEEIHVPDEAIAFISIKFTKKQQGLINVSGFHVDPGFRGRIKFSVYNAGSKPTVLDVGKPLFMIWFSNLVARETEPYNGGHQGQKCITAKDVEALQGEIASPAALKELIEKEVGRIKTELWVYRICGTALMSIFLIIAGLWIKAICDSAAPPTTHERGVERGSAEMPAPKTQSPEKAADRTKPLPDKPEKGSTELPAPNTRSLEKAADSAKSLPDKASTH